jgi:diguanylate cyclase (GGDEF)-like protein/PAS domain S-box-containing protein
MLTTRRLMAGYLGLMVLASAAYFLWPSMRVLSICALGVGSAGAILTGLRHRQPLRPVPWLLIAVALVVATATRLIDLRASSTFGSSSTASWIVGFLDLGVVILLVVAARAMATSQMPRAPAVIDATIVILGLWLLNLVVATPPADAWPATRFAYFARDVLVLAIALQLATSFRRHLSARLLAVGLIGLLAFDILGGLQRVDNVPVSSATIDLNSVIFFVAVGAAGLVPSMAKLGTGRTSIGTDLSVWRLWLIGAAALAPFAAVLSGSTDLTHTDRMIAAATAGVIVVLVLARMAGIATRLRRQLEAERILREATADLAEAGSRDSVTAAADRALRRFGPTLGYRIQVGQAPQRAAIRPGASDPHRRWFDRKLWTSDELRPMLDVLTNQVDLAINRIDMNAELMEHARQSYFRSLVQNSGDVIIILGDRDRIRFASPSAATVFGAKALPGVALMDLVVPDDRRGAEDLLTRARTSDSAVPLYADWTVLSTSPTCMRVACRDLRSDPAIDGVVVTMRDVTEERRLERELTHHAFHDPLTGLGNRRFFTDHLHAEMRSSAADGRLLALFMVDIDDLKLINDGYGHHAGDVLLNLLSERLRSFIAGRSEHAEHDLAARLGGDEFAVLLTRVTDPDAADGLATQLAGEIRKPMRADGHEITCVASIGVATTADDDGSKTELFRHADLALHAAKQAGSGQWRHYEPALRGAMAHRIELRDALQHAIKDDALFLEYQPIVKLATGEPVGLEALLRWQHPTRGRIGPDRFIDIAEESGLIVPIGEWVLLSAVAAVRRWSSAIPSPPYVGVNVSASQFRRPGFTAMVEQVITQSGLAAQRLLLEITESLLLRDDDDVWRDLQRLRDIGVRIAIDDFGTGYSALSYLCQVPLDVVKLDRLFIQTATRSAPQQRLIDGIVGLTDALGMQIIAEGIETERERALATRSGCAFGQGYLFSSPLPDDRVCDWLATHRITIT